MSMTVAGLVANITQIVPVVIDNVRQFGELIMEPPWVVFLGLGLLYAGFRLGIKVLHAAKK